MYTYIHVHSHYTAVYTSVNGPCRPVYTAVYVSCTRPVYTIRVHWLCRGGVHGPCTPPSTRAYVYTCRVYRYTVAYTVRAVYTARSRTCTRPYNGHLHLHTCTWAVETAVTRSCTCHVHGRKRPLDGSRTGPCTRPLHFRVTAGVHVYTCTRAVYTVVRP